MSIVKIAPSILSADFAHLAEEVQAAEAGGADLIHVDVMDGHFVPNITIGPLVVQALKTITTLPLDCHLMISEPLRYIPAFVDAGADLISVHIEVEHHLDRTLNAIRDAGLKAGIVLNPATPLAVLEESLYLADYVLLMSVNPGFEKQRFIPQVLDKISRLRDMIYRLGLNVRVEVDGGIKLENVADVVRHGGEWIVAGSAIFGKHADGKRKDPRETTSALRGKALLPLSV